MAKYLVKTITHTTGEVFKSVIKIKDNEKYETIEVDKNTQKDVLDKVRNGESIEGQTITIDMNGG
ncbi:DUF1381 domain-containing protein [Staphylococcus shinii]|uniref:DUF1381 domain-containing protein n=1 Tax=Staphylococcus shinii TaxID=2912228 RepID=UPI00298F19EB|nr:hypothetical protein [Staphylococcus shinii]MDW8564696.1 hypothetical protein [Staphylococcus shinii]